EAPLVADRDRAVRSPIGQVDDRCGAGEILPPEEVAGEGQLRHVCDLHPEPHQVLAPGELAGALAVLAGNRRQQRPDPGALAPPAGAIAARTGEPWRRQWSTVGKSCQNHRVSWAATRISAAGDSACWTSS